MTTAGSVYQHKSRYFLVQAREELATGDLAQASEKGWGAAAQMVKAIAEQRGWDHRGHAQLFRAVDTLANETGDDVIDRLFKVASALHVNFYEDWSSAASIARGLDDIARFVSKLEPLV